MEERESDNWPAFTDLLGAFVLVIFMALLFFMINFRSAESQVHAYGKELKKQEAALHQRERELVQLQQQIEQQRAHLSAERKANRRLLEDLRQTEKRLRTTLGAKKELEDMFERLKQERLEIEKARQKAETDLALAQEALAKAEAERRQTQSALVKAEDERQQAKAALTKAEHERQICQRQVEAYIGVRRRIVGEVFSALRKNARQPENIRFDAEGGSIVLGANILFSAGSPNLQQSGQNQLGDIWKHLHNVLRNPIHQPYIAGILLEGYTSSEGDASFNWQLSTRRALSALQYLSQHGANEWSKKGLIAATGYGPTRLVQNPDGSENQAASRRIAMRILFRDREQLELLMQQFQKR
jgi:outer membrane protein OmpA-like peptidoglycan-associated protein